MNTERETVLEMAKTKCEDIDRYLHKEISYLEELIFKADQKQKAEHTRFWHQCDQVKHIVNELDDHRMELVKRVLTVQDHLGVDTGPLDVEGISTSGLHNDVQDGSFSKNFGQ